MGHHHELYAHKKHPDTLVIYTEDIISPVIRSQGSMAKTHVKAIT